MDETTSSMAMPATWMAYKIDYGCYVDLVGIAKSPAPGALSVRPQRRHPRLVHGDGAGDLVRSRGRGWESGAFAVAAPLPRRLP